jgi:hypothetical protein
MIQYETLTSPRDEYTWNIPPKTTRFGTIGQLPPKGISYPGWEVPAVWRGKDVGGEDQGEWKGETAGRFPHVDYCRYSTLPG